METVNNYLTDLRSYVLDTELPKKEIENLLKLASIICETPVSIVNIVDDKYQMTIASHGDFEEKTIPAKNGICHRVVKTNEMLVLNNLDEHQEIQNSLTDSDKQSIKFYAGAPITTSNGINIGAVCMIDSKPNKLDQSQKESLRIISKEVMQKIEFSKKSKVLKHYNELLEKTTDLVFMVDPKTQKILDVNEGFCEILGWDRSDVIHKKLNELIVTEYKGSRKVANWIKKYTGTGSDFSSNLKILTSENNTHWVKCHFSFNDDNQIIVTAIDINHLFNTENEIQQLQKKYEKIIDATSDVIWEYDVIADSYVLSKSFTELFGYDTEEVVSRAWWIANVHPQDRARIKKQLKKFEKDKTQTYWSAFYRFKTKDGAYKFINGNAYVERNEKGKPVSYIGALEDFTEVRKAQKEQELLLSRLTLASELANVGYWEIDIKDGSVSWSDEMYRLLEVEKKDVEPSLEYLAALASDEDKVRLSTLIKEVKIETNGASLEHEVTLENGKKKYLHHKGELIFNEDEEATVLLISTQDISERILYEKNIEDSLKEKEVLLSEIHHRVKNNLAVISALLQLEELSTDNNDLVKGVITRSLSRIRSMAKLHEALYQSNTFSKINVYDYFSEILKDMYAKIFPSGEIQLAMPNKKIELNINQAVPTALIVNELITNSIKHAFPEGSKGVINVGIEKEGGYLFVKVSDNGKGVEEDFDLKNPKSLGMTLIKLLGNQLNGEFYTDTDAGFSVTLSFKLETKKGSSSTL